MSVKETSNKRRSFENVNSITPKFNNPRERSRERRYKSDPLISPLKSDITKNISKERKPRKKSSDSNDSAQKDNATISSSSPGKSKRRWNSLGILVRKTSLNSQDADSSNKQSGWEIAASKLSMAGLFNQAFVSSNVSDRRKTSRILKLRDLQLKKSAKFRFRLAVRITIFTIRLMRSHNLRNKEDDDEVSPYIKGLHFHEYEEPVDLLFDRSKFKANKSVRIPEETKRILCKRPKDRTDHEIYMANIALRNIKAIADYPAAMQRKIVQYGQYESYEAKRILLRQGHPPSAFYFILSGQAVIMKMDESHDYARPVRHMKKGDEFGDIALVHMQRRAATVICKEPCEFLSIGKKDFYKIFMSGGEKSIDDKDQENFLKSVSVLDGWPTEQLKEHPDKTKFLYYKRGEVIAPETHLFDNLIIVKSGSIQILKKLKKVHPFEWKKKKPEIKFVSEKEKRDNRTKREVFRRLILSELKVPVKNVETEDNNMEEYPGKAKPFKHPSEMIPEELEAEDELGEMENSHRITGNPPLSKDRFQNFEDTYIQTGTTQQKNDQGKRLGRSRKKDGFVLIAKNVEKRRESAIEAEKEMMGFEEENRTAKHELTDKGMKRKDPDDLTLADINPEFVHVKTLEKGQYIGIPESILERQPNFCIVSNGADCILIDRHLYNDHAPERLKNKLRSEECPFPTDEELQQQLQAVIDWESYRKIAMKQTLLNLKKERQLRESLTI